MKASPAPATGGQAFGRAAAESDMGSAEVPLAPSGEAMDIVRIAGSRTFRLLDGVWTDTAFDPAKMSAVAVPFLSDDYFRLASSRPDISAAMALGMRVIVIADGVAYEIVGEDEPGDDVPLPSDVEEPSQETPGGEREDVGGSEQVKDRAFPCASFVGAIGLIVFPLTRRARKPGRDRARTPSGESKD
jgi:hypothetical protein